MISMNKKFSQQISIIYFNLYYYLLQLFYNSKTNSHTHNVTKAEASSKTGEKIVSIIISRAHISSFVIQLKSFGRVGSARSGTGR